MEVMTEIFAITFKFLKDTKLDIFGFNITIFQIMLIGIAIEVCAWLLLMWRGENGGNN